MDLVTAVLLAGIAVLVVSVYVIHSAEPPLPGPPLRDYLPGGAVYSLLKDTRLLGETLAKFRGRYGEVFHLWLGPLRVVTTSNREDVTQVVSMSTDFLRSDSTVRVLAMLAPGGLIATQASPTHRAIKQTLRDNFNHAMLARFHRPMSDAVIELCDSLSGVVGKNAVDLSGLFGVTTLRILTNVAFGSGMRKEERVEFNSNLNSLFEELIREIIGYPVRQWLTVFGIRNNFLMCVKRIREASLMFIERRLAESCEQRESRLPDVLDVVLEISNTDTNLATALTVDFAISGSHTMHESLVWAIYELCCNPRVVEELSRELDAVVGHKPLSETLTLTDVNNLKYLKQIWNETLRKRPITGPVMRVASREVALKGSGVQLKKGMLVLGVIRANHIDPGLWTNPLEFRPERWTEDRDSESNRALPGSYLPFGAGIFSCPGKFLADYEGPLIIAELYRRFSFELDCRPEEVVTRTCLVETARCTRGNEETGVPFKVRKKVR